MHGNTPQRKDQFKEKTFARTFGRTEDLGECQERFLSFPITSCRKQTSPTICKEQIPSLGVWTGEHGMGGGKMRLE